MGLNICNFKGPQGDFDKHLGLKTASFKHVKTEILGIIMKELEKHIKPLLLSDLTSSR